MHVARSIATQLARDHGAVDARGIQEMAECGCATGTTVAGSGRIRQLARGSAP
jgi:hypothetical protein